MLGGFFRPDIDSIEKARLLVQGALVPVDHEVMMLQYEQPDREIISCVAVAGKSLEDLEALDNIRNHGGGGAATLFTRMHYAVRDYQEVTDTLLLGW